MFCFVIITFRFVLVFCLLIKIQCLWIVLSVQLFAFPFIPSFWWKSSSRSLLRKCWWEPCTQVTACSCLLAYTWIISLAVHMFLVDPFRIKESVGITPLSLSFDCYSRDIWDLVIGLGFASLVGIPQKWCYALLIAHLRWCRVLFLIFPIADYVHFEHFIRVVSAKYLHCEVTLSPLVIMYFYWELLWN